MRAARAWSCRGSSPRLRGTRQRRDHRPAGARFIPAPAGNAYRCPAGCTHGPVHPRACGERDDRRRPAPRLLGSSPRLRGTLNPTAYRWETHRFIPAPAGNAPPSPRQHCGPAVHPRACGERAVDFESTAYPGGSSPRLRGTLDVARPIVPIVRFIPAPAGNAMMRCRRSINGTVHPRACGERLRTCGAAFAAVGSSPRLRGTRFLDGRRVRVSRFIPAPAGNAAALRTGHRRLAVHPRACGERSLGAALESVRL